MMPKLKDILVVRGACILVNIFIDLINININYTINGFLFLYLILVHFCCLVVIIIVMLINKVARNLFLGFSNTNRIAFFARS